MIKAFSDEIARHVNKQFRILTLQVPLATGAVIWALELAGGVFPITKSAGRLSKR